MNVIRWWRFYRSLGFLLLVPILACLLFYGLYKLYILVKGSVLIQSLLLFIFFLRLLFYFTLFFSILISKRLVIVY